MKWRELRDTFESVVELTEEECNARLAQIAESDPVLATELRALLEHDRAARMFLDRSARSAPRGRRLEPAAGMQLGSYRLERTLGSGGMGTVWEAVQDRPARRVALKILAGSSWSRAERWRFEQEAHVLATLSHPAIAQIYEAGCESRDGAEVAWFAMELVDDARDLLSWVDERRASRAQRLALFGELCDAVQYGHRRGVIHRDLKPANILVGRGGHLKLIDFGVARAVEGSEATPSLRTQTGELVGTLQYMAPEQLAGKPSDVDARCDVYALGVVLYRMLCGVAPFDFGGASLGEIARIVREEDPRPPSSCRRELAGDLEWILLQTLEKDPARRYQSVAELVEDLRRFEADEPVRARPPSAVYRLKKFVRRHRALVAIAGAVVLGLSLALAGVISGLVRARDGERKATLSSDEATRQAQLAEHATEEAQRQAHIADRQARRNRTVLGVIEAVFDGIEDTVAGRDVRVADLLDAAAPDADSGAGADPDVEFAVRVVRGKIYSRLHLFEEARPELERAIALFPELEEDPADRDRYIEARSMLGTALTQLGEPVAGEAMLRQALAEAESAEHDTVWAEALRDLTQYLVDKGALDEVLDNTQVLTDFATSHGDTGLALVSLNLRCLALQGRGRVEEALSVLEELWKRRTSLQGERNPHAVTALFNYATALHEAGRLEQAAMLYPKAIELSREIMGPTHNQTLTALNNFALLAMARGDSVEATKRLREIVAAYDGTGRPPTLEHLLAINNLGMVINQSGDFAAAEPVLRRAADLSRDLLAPDDVQGLQLRFNHGACLAWMKRWSEAEPILTEHYQRLVELLPAGHPTLGKAKHTMADAYRVNGMPDEARRWREGP